MSSPQTLETHKWFAGQFKEATAKRSKEMKSDMRRYNLYIKIIIVGMALTLGSYLFNGAFHRFVLRMATLTIYMCITIDKIERLNQETGPTVYMQFTRNGIFYKNTHYFFAGTQRQLEDFLHKEKECIEIAKKEKGFGYGDHDQLWDTPVDTFCDDRCDCENKTLPVNNYDCSHWELTSFETKEQLLYVVNTLKQRLNNRGTNGFYNEIVCIENDAPHLF